MRPFFSFYGSKYRMAARLPAPRYATVVEPFAGSMGYSTRHEPPIAIGVERDPVIAGLWGWLIGADEAEVLNLPPVLPGDDLRCLLLSDAERALIGLWINKGMTAPCNVPSKWMREYETTKPETFWGAPVRERIADQLHKIRSWSMYEGQWFEAPDVEGTWFIDAPYRSKPGYRYTYGPDQIDYGLLAEWCRSRRGQVIVCERAGADWLPFRPVDFDVKAARNGGTGYSPEAIWTNDMEDS